MMTDTDWSFSLRSATGIFNYDSDEGDEDNPGDVGTSSHLSSSSSQMLQQIDLAAREDSAQYKPNPWSIARVNAASRSRQPNATVIPVAEKSSTKKLPQGAIVDAFKRQAQKPSSTAKNSSTQPNRLPVLQKNPTCSSFNAAPDNLVLVSSCSHTSTAHIVTSAVNPVPIPLQSPTIMEQRRSPPPSSFLPRRAPSTHIDQLFTRSPNPSFTPNLKRTFPFSSPGPPPPNLRYDISGKRPTLSQIPVHFRPHTSQPQTTHNNNNNNEHAVTDPITRTAPVCQGNKTLMHPPQPFHHPAPVNLERTTVSPHPHYTSHLPPHLQLDRPIIKSSPKSQEIHPTPSFAQARRFFEYSSLPVTAVGDPSPELRPLRESRHPTSPPPSLRIPSPPRKDTNPYDQLPPSPDAEWSTLKPQTRAAKAKAKPKVPDAKSGKFRLPLSLGSVTPKEPAQQRPRVITYLPPPPPKKRKIGTESYSRTSDVEPDVSFQAPRTRKRGLYSPPPSDETAPSSPPTPSVQFDSNGLSSRYKVVRAKIRQRKALDVQLWDTLGLESCGVVYRDPEHVADTWNGEIAFVNWQPCGE